ncbi:hypothetical protein HYS31_07090 [Candidatus Woesearchaeota archaeon]|nr:hypothetical protein [Candidatus Woesearchaeota archaeon]
MEFGKFFSLTKSKLILFILFLLLAIQGFVFDFSHTCPLNVECKQPFIDTLSNYVSMIFGGYFAFALGKFVQDLYFKPILSPIIGLLAGLIFLIIYNYILSSFVVLIYEKFTK